LKSARLEHFAARLSGRLSLYGVGIARGAIFLRASDDGGVSRCSGFVLGEIGSIGWEFEVA
jgi:hypothetical protein